MRLRVFDVVVITGRLAVVAIARALLASGTAYAATNWVVGLSAGSSGEAQPAAVSNLTISAVASPGASHVVYPGGNGDVVVTISNPNPFPVTITAVNLPTNTTCATGCTTSALTATKAGCLFTTPSDVAWTYSTSTSDSSHTLRKAFTVAARGKADNPLTVTFLNCATMTAAASAACENTYFSMSALTGATATYGPTTASINPTSDSWTS
jgi:hypothetical protein